MKDLFYKVFAGLVLGSWGLFLLTSNAYAQYGGGGPVGGEVMGEATNSGISTPFLIGTLSIITLAAIIFFLFRRRSSQ